MTPRLVLKQSQQLVMTPQLQQAIKLLQYSNVELTEFVALEMEKNPLLDKSERYQKLSPKSDGIEERGVSQSKLLEMGEMPEVDQALINVIGTYSETEAPLDTDYSENIFNNDSLFDQPTPISNEQLGFNSMGTIREGSGGFDEDSFERTIGQKTSLKIYLSDQLKIVSLPQIDQLIASYLIEMIDESGYLLEDLSDLPKQLGCEEEDVERVVNILQGLEPLGIFSRSLSECLSIQLRELDRLDPYMQILIDNLDLLGKRDLPALKKLCGVDSEDLKDMVVEIQNLNPKPGLVFTGGDPIQPVVPDVFVFKNPSDKWIVELNNNTLPKVLVNNIYYNELCRRGSSKKDKAYISDCYANANWLVKALDQRARTILKVCSELVKQQENFFNRGVRYLVPLRLQTIADAIGMHESTVSRVTANKFLGTDRGIFEMKYFFTTSINASDGNDVFSSEAVRFRIKELIDAEDPKEILPDDKIVKNLKARGIGIARRTVAKYREAMNIPSSVQRRRQKNFKL